MAITVTQLTAFLAVVRGGSITAAAEELVVTQPSVSAAVSALARELGCDLFERAGRGIRTTAAGVAFAPYATDVIGLMTQGQQAAREAHDATTRALRIAAVTTAAESLVPPLMLAFCQQHPEIELTLDVKNRDEVLHRVLNHTVDVGVAGRLPADERILAEPLMDHEIVLITAADDPAVQAGHLEDADLGKRSWLLREPGSGTRELNEQFLAARGIRPATLTLGSNGAIKQAARTGLGVSLLSRAAVETELAMGVLAELRVGNLPEPRPWFVLWSAVGPMRSPVEAFIEFARAYCSQDRAGLPRR